MKTWLITGCSSGLGKGLAEAVLEHGDQAVVTARRPETLRHFTDRYPETALALPLDVSDDTQAEAAVKAALARSFPDRLLRPFHQYQRRQYQ